MDPGEGLLDSTQILAAAYISAVFTKTQADINSTKADIISAKARFELEAIRLWQHGEPLTTMLKTSADLYKHSASAHMGYNMNRFTIKEHLRALNDAYVAFSESVGLPYFTFEEAQATIAADAATNAFKY